MRGDLKVGTWAEIDDGCPVTYTFDGDDNVELHMGDRRDGFQMIFTRPALERLVLVASKALADVRAATPRSGGPAVG